MLPSLAIFLPVHYSITAYRKLAAINLNMTVAAIKLNTCFHLLTQWIISCGQLWANNYREKETYIITLQHQFYNLNIIQTCSLNMA